MENPLTGGGLGELCTTRNSSKGGPEQFKQECLYLKKKKSK